MVRPHSLQRRHARRKGKRLEEVVLISRGPSLFRLGFLCPWQVYHVQKRTPEQSCPLRVRSSSKAKFTQSKVLAMGLRAMRLGTWLKAAWAARPLPGFGAPSLLGTLGALGQAVAMRLPAPGRSGPHHLLSVSVVLSSCLHQDFPHLHKAVCCGSRWGERRRGQSP